MNNVRTSLEKLTETIQAMVEDAKAKNNPARGRSLFWQWKVTGFEYTDQGITRPNAQGNCVTKTTWLRALSALEKGVLEHPTYAAATGDLEKAFTAISEIREHLERFVRTTLHIYLQVEEIKDVQREVGNTIERFLDQLSGGLVTYKANVELQRVTLHPAAISSDAGISIRQPKKEDLEKTVRVIAPFHGSFGSYPSAIFEVQLRAAPGNNMLLQAAVERCVALLRLFNVGSVNWKSMTCPQIPYSISSSGEP